MVNINQIDEIICIETDGKTKYDFNSFTFPLKFASTIYHRNLTLQEAKDNQQELKILMNKLNNDYRSSNQIKKMKKIIP